MARRHPLQKTFAPLLLPLSLIYGAAALSRRRLAERGLPPARFFSRPCISVGNISWGGTGKTPVTDWLLDWADARGLRAAVLTRGYGAKAPFRPFPVTANASPAHSGDEPLMLARQHPDALILADPDRNRAARHALGDAFPPHLFILDDGFQHLSTGRHLDLVLLDPDDLGDDLSDGPDSGWNRVLPAGTWREPAAALNAAHAFLIKLDPAVWPDALPRLRRRLTSLPRPIFAFRLHPRGLRSRGQGCLLPASAVPGPYLLTSAVGNPVQVRRSVEAFMGRAPEEHLIFPDHHDYSRPEDARRLLAPGLPILCTAKDAVKLDSLNLPAFYALDVKADFYARAWPDDAQGPDFENWWNAWWASAPSLPHARLSPSEQNPLRSTRDNTGEYPCEKA